MDKSIAVPPEFVLHIRQEIEIHAPMPVVFDSILEEAGPGFKSQDGTSMKLRLEAWPGGRWYRDLGNNTGHWWGHVQVIKPPTLLELYGPMFMSHAVISHVQYRLTEKADQTLLTLTHRAFGEISAEHREGVTKGWGKILSSIKSRAQR
jgi:Activator of Hsp90 ATPase homolog 1-like protein